MTASAKLRTVPRGDSSPSLFDAPPVAEAVRRIPLRGKKGAGLYAIIDEADYALVKGYKLYAIVNRRGSVYVGASKHGRITLLHRLIMDAPEGVQVDHKGDNPLDCRRCNLRLATQGQNMRNTRSRRGSSSVYKGVRRTPYGWVATIRLNGKNVHLGSFKVEEDAARAYDAAMREHFPTFGRVNFAREGELSALRAPAVAGGPGGGRPREGVRHA